MQISRHLLLASAVAACLTPSLTRAFDNEAQIRARQALEEKMKQLDVQPPAVTNAVPKTAVTKPVPAKPAPPVITVTPAKATVEPPAQAAPPISRPAVTAPGYVSTPSNDSATSDKLSDALHQKMQEVGSQPAETTAPAVAAQKPAKPAKAPTFAPAQPAVAAPMSAPATSANYAPLPTTSTSPKITLPEQPTPAPTSAMTQQEPAQPSISLPPLSGPPSSLSQAKQQKLDELLQQYRADQLSPQQYHEQRAKILAQP